MSAYAEKHRKAMKDKAHRMANGDPHQRVDASSWREAEPQEANIQTGERPVSKRAFKKGGKVEGEKAHQHMGRSPRKSGGKALTADSYQNRDMKEANEERDGPKHVGGFKRGGRPHRADGGTQIILPASAPSKDPNTQKEFGLLAGLKRGGTAKHSDAKEDMALIKKEVKPSALRHERARGGSMSVSDGSLQGTRPTGGREAHARGGKTDPLWIEHANMKKGALHKALHVPEDKKIPEKKMAKAEHSKNPHERHMAQAAENMRPGRKSGGRAKGKTDINIIISAGGKGQDPGMQQPMMPPKPSAIPVPPPAGPPSGAPMGGAPAMPPGGMPMPRKSGGRTPHMKAGAGSGEGRLEKIEEYGRK